MSQNYSKSALDSGDDSVVSINRPNWWMLLVLPAWVTVGFFVAQILIEGLVWLMVIIGIPLKLVNAAVLETIFTVLVYSLTIFLVIIAPWLAKKVQTSRSEIGLTRLPKWSDILLAPAGLVIYLITSSILILLAARVLPWFNVNQAQSTGFGQLSTNYELVLAFFALVIVAPVAEEILFRGYLYGKLKKFVPVWIAILATSLLFGAIHGEWNIFFDTFALSIVLCLLREFTGNIWSSILLHMIKNGIAFYVLFIYPTLLTTLVK
ncbi:MAG TPA: type II CAAX endopeptidase family protein [Candidatus Saccharimonadales bacterium]|nr:type II CAAX endopeptidase family protein [Candidatus Saccharimonadales bacterium]